MSAPVEDIMRASANFGGQPQLTTEQQRLLRAALASNVDFARKSSSSRSSVTAAVSLAFNGTGVDPASQFKLGSSESIDSGPFGDNPLIDFGSDAPAFPIDDEDDGQWHENGDFQDESFGESGEKRKSPEDDEDDDEDEHDSKRKEDEEKGPKKPGRKPLTSEPTTKRKAQNRAAQRAFRERKERHLKDLELKVSEFQKASEAANDENALLRAQLHKLSDELREYRRRLSITNSGNSPPRASLPSFQSSGSGLGSTDFAFDFPRFGNSSVSEMPKADSLSAMEAISPSQLARPGASSVNTGSGSRSSSFAKTYSNSSSLSPPSFSSNTPQSNEASNSINGIFTSGFDAFANTSYGFGTTTTASPGPFTSFADISQSHEQRRPSNPASASASVTSNGGSPPMLRNDGTSSCGTSPEPFVADHPQQTDGRMWATGVKNEPVPSPNIFNFDTPNNDLQSFSWLANQNGGNFDPTLFGNYRESQEAVVGNTDFSGGFYDDTFTNFAELDSGAFNFDSTANIAPQSQSQPSGKMSLMEQVERQRDGGDTLDANLVVPGEVKRQRSKKDIEMMTTHKIWAVLKNCPKFKDGGFDVDELCAELSEKATCSETGMVVPKEYVHAALWRLAGEEEAAGQATTA